MEKTAKTQWLLLRGLTRGQYHWDKFPKMLQAKFPDDEVILIDLPGNGYRNKEISPIKIAEYTQDLRQKRVPKGALNIIALSLGAMVALDWMANYPQEITRAYLINTSAKGILPFYKRLLINNYLDIVKALFSSAYVREQIVLKITSNNLEAQERVLLSFEKYAEMYPIQPLNLLRQLVASSHFHFPSSLPAGKIKVLVSQNDRLVSSQNSVEIAKILNTEPIIHPWAGHDLVLDDPDFVLDALTNE